MNSIVNRHLSGCVNSPILPFDAVALLPQPNPRKGIRRHDCQGHIQWIAAVCSRPAGVLLSTAELRLGSQVLGGPMAPLTGAFQRMTAPGPKKCKICGELAPVFGEVDFNRSCREVSGHIRPNSGIMVFYNRCPKCEFLFSASFDSWSIKEFLAEIYNDKYIEVDQHYQTVRPTSNAGFLYRAFARQRTDLDVLDYGGGNGALAQLLRQSGFRSAATYDPLVAEFSGQPKGKFNVVSCFETLEHTPNPLAAIGEISAIVDRPGIVVFSTAVQPADFMIQGLNWWYVGPRNGHISIFSRKSLTMAWQRFGFRIGSVNDNFHVAFRQVPTFAKHLFSANVE
jgi:hypothetical protein